VLVLFDIDGTLLISLRAGIGAMTTAIEELHGVTPDFEGVEIHGRLDRLIWRDLSAKHGLPASEADHATFRATYARHLHERLAARNTAEALPGAQALVESVRSVPGVTIGLLTGNYMETGRAKVRFAGFDPDVFVVNAWGDEGPDRRSLVPVAHGRYRERLGTPIARERVVIIGDTPADVDCAKAHGARVLAVATGGFKADALRGTEADRVVDDLRDTAGLTDWIMKA
jgi:phosphoglycolate phosphatase